MAINELLRYKNDPLFRKRKIINAVKSNRKRNIVNSKIDLSAENWRSLNLLINDEKVTTKCCRVGHLAKAINRTDQTIRIWERRKWLPKAIRYKGHRYYTENQYKLIVDIFHRYPNDLDKFFLVIKNKWSYK